MSEGEISIKINICDRFYPLRIVASEEEGVRKAAKMINERVRFYMDNFSVQDKQDALAMVALESAVETRESGSDHVASEELETKLSSLEQLLRL